MVTYSTFVGTRGLVLVSTDTRERTCTLQFQLNGIPLSQINIFYSYPNPWVLESSLKSVGRDASRIGLGVRSIGQIASIIQWVRSLKVPS